jgi:Spy/CpxP family protein refolding chaperone
MNLTRFLVLPGAVAIACLVAAPILPSLAQTESAPTQQRMRRSKVNLNLDAGQKQAMERIKASTRAQIEAVMNEELTSEQRASLQAARANRQKPNFAALNLSADKQQRIRERIRGIREAAQAEMKQILTPEQQQLLEQRRQMKRQNFGNRQNRQSPGSQQVQPGTAQ